MTNTKLYPPVESQYSSVATDSDAHQSASLRNTKHVTEAVAKQDETSHKAAASAKGSSDRIAIPLVCVGMFCGFLAIASIIYGRKFGDGTCAAMIVTGTISFVMGMNVQAIVDLFNSSPSKSERGA